MRHTNCWTDVCSATKDSGIEFRIPGTSINMVSLFVLIMEPVFINGDCIVDPGSKNCNLED